MLQVSSSFIKFYLLVCLFSLCIYIKSVTRIDEERDNDEKQNTFHRSGLYFFDIIYDDSTAISTDSLHYIISIFFLFSIFVEWIFESIFKHFCDLVHLSHISSFKFRSIDDILACIQNS